MRKLVADAGVDGAVVIDSAGTAAYHAGERADPRSRAAAERRGISLDSVARQFVAADFARFDYVLAMDRSNLVDLEDIAPTGGGYTLRLLRSFDPASPGGAEVPDPYYGGERGFDDVLDICDAACRGLLAHLIDHHGLGGR